MSWIATIRPWVVVSFTLVSRLAGADPGSFVRIGEAAGLRRGEVALAYGAEGARDLARLGPAGTKIASAGLTHRLVVAGGIRDWLSVLAEQSVKQKSPTAASVGVFAPEVRVLLPPVGRLLVHAFGQGRVRVSGKRPSTGVAGFLVAHPGDRVDAAAKIGFESSVSASERESGLRYEAGVSWRLLPRVRLAAEAWGHETRSSAGVWGRSHHLGPSVQTSLGPWRVGVVAGVGFNDEEGVQSLEGVGLARIGVDL